MQLLFKFATSPQPVRRYTRCRRFCALHWSWSFRGLQRMHITSADDRQCVQLRRVCLSRMAWLIGLRFTNSLCRDRRAQRCKSIVVNNDPPTHKHTNTDVITFQTPRARLSPRVSSSPGLNFHVEIDYIVRFGCSLNEPT